MYVPGRPTVAGVYNRKKGSTVMAKAKQSAYPKEVYGYLNGYGEVEIINNLGDLNKGDVVGVYELKTTGTISVTITPTKGSK
jgi:hypothetical protein